MANNYDIILATISAIAHCHAQKYMVVQPNRTLGFRVTLYPEVRTHILVKANPVL